MGQMTEQGALLGQVERLHTEVRQIAENMAMLHTLGNTIDQKSTVIGRALIEQKQVTEQIQENQDKVKQQMEECTAFANQRRQSLQLSVDDVVVAIQQLRDLESREDALLQSLSKLSKNQAVFMKANHAFAKTAETDLESVKSMIQAIHSCISKMDFTDQVAFIQDKMGKIRGDLTSYVDNRNRLAKAMNQQMAGIENKMQEMQSDMDKQRASIAEIASISKACEEKTNAMCARLEQLLAEKKTKEEHPVSLEDLFAAPDVDITEEFYGQDLADGIEDDPDYHMQGSVGEETKVTSDTKNEMAPEIKVFTKEPIQKKKSFFTKLFRHQ